MRNGFGVVHKALEESVARRIEPVAPSTSVDVYRNSKKKNTRAALANWTAKAGAAAIGFGVGARSFNRVAPKIKYLNRPSTIKIFKKPVNISAETKRHLGFMGTTGGLSGAFGYSAAVGHKKKIKENPEYKYKEPKRG